MTLDELRAAKAELEMQISQAVASHVDAFRERTGMTPSRIDIPMIGARIIRSPYSEYVVGPARVEIEL